MFKTLALIFWGIALPLIAAEETFILLDARRNIELASLGPGIHRRVSPCSTFKIPLSLMGYDSGILLDETAPVFPFQEGYSTYRESWKSSQTPQTWIQTSCVWYSQVLADLMGLQLLTQYISAFDYGNRDLTGGLTAFWLTSTLEISPYEQALFLQKLVQRTLPISNRAFDMTCTLFKLHDLPNGWTLYGKTGYGTFPTDAIRWFVGWIERAERTYVFAYNLRDTTIDLSLTIPRVTELLLNLDAAQ